jgi:hypothetical protein
LEPREQAALEIWATDSVFKILDNQLSFSGALD